MVSRNALANGSNGRDGPHCGPLRPASQLKPARELIGSSVRHRQYEISQGRTYHELFCCLTPPIEKIRVGLCVGESQTEVLR